MSGTVQFQYENVFTVPITEEFVDVCTDGAVAIHVYSKRMDSFSQVGSDDCTQPPPLPNEI